jgi:signal transduction histidine kinase/CheY-like chemotaxis protein
MLNTLINKLVNIGVHPSHTRNEASKIKLINVLAFVPLPVFLFTSIYCIIFNFQRIVYTNGIAALAMMLILFFNYKQKYSYAKTIFVCANALIILIYHKLMDNEASMFFYFFPLILCFLLFYKPKEEKFFLYFTVFFTVACILLTLFLPSAFFEPTPLSESLHLFINRFNSIICTIILILYTYYIFRTNTRNEKQLIAAKELAEEASKAKAIFLSNMSHELRTPLNGIVGTANLLNVEEPKEIKQHVTVLKNLSEHMMGLVNNVLDYSKIESGKLNLYHTFFNINELVQKLFSTFDYQFKSKGIQYKIDMDPNLKEINVFSDDLRLQQILNNLISNALKFTQEGEVVLNITLVKKDADTVTVLFNVVDNGIGIEATQLESIFESFNQGDSATTRKYGGTGLGLSISSNLVKLFDSKLHVSSTIGKGSNFYFSIKFPLYKRDAISPSHKTDSIQLKDIKILIAEDNPINMMVARKILQKWGAIVEEASNGLIAVEKCKAQQFDAVLIDLEMPEMDGKTAVKEINQLDIKIPAIAFTAAMYENMEADLLNCGFVDFVLKPFQPDTLYQKIYAILEQKKASSISETSF